MTNYSIFYSIYKYILIAYIYIYIPDIVDALLQKKRDLSIEVDNFGWTPFHYAAYAGFGEMVEKLLEYDKKPAYIVDNDRKRTVPASWPRWFRTSGLIGSTQHAARSRSYGCSSQCGCTFRSEAAQVNPQDGGACHDKWSRI